MSGTYRGVYVRVTDEAWGKLWEIARARRRDARDQAAIILEMATGPRKFDPEDFPIHFEAPE